MTIKRIILTFLFLWGSASAQSAFPMTITGDIGKPATFTKIPERVVAIGSENVELLSVLDVKPVGFAVLKADFALGKKPAAPPNILGANVLADAAYVGLSRQPSVETVVNLKPDLVLTYGSVSSPEPYGALSKMVPTLAYDFDTSHTWREPLKAVAKLLGKQDKANIYLGRYDKKQNELRVRIAPAIRQHPKTTFLYMPNASSIMLLGNKFGFGKALMALGMKIDTPPGISPNMMAQPITPEALLTYKHSRIVVLTLDGYQKNEAANVAFAQIKKQGVPVYFYDMPQNQPYSGPLTDLKRMEDMVSLIKN